MEKLDDLDNFGKNIEFESDGKEERSDNTVVRYIRSERREREVKEFSLDKMVVLWEVKEFSLDKNGTLDLKSFCEGHPWHCSW